MEGRRSSGRLIPDKIGKKTRRIEEYLRPTGLLNPFSSNQDAHDWLEGIVLSEWWTNYSVPVVYPDPALRSYARPYVLNGRVRLFYFRPREMYNLVRLWRGRAMVGYEQGIIRLPREEWSRLKILHMVSHLLQIEGPKHGRQWRRILLDMMEEFCGKECATALKESYRKNKAKRGWHPATAASGRSWPLLEKWLKDHGRR